MPALIALLPASVYESYMLILSENNHNLIVSVTSYVRNLCCNLRASSINTCTVHLAI